PASSPLLLAPSGSNFDEINLKQVNTPSPADFITLSLSPAIMILLLFSFRHRIHQTTACSLFKLEPSLMRKKEKHRLNQLHCLMTSRPSSRKHFNFCTKTSAN